MITLLNFQLFFLLLISLPIRFYFLEKYEAKGNKIAIAPIPNIGIGVAINDRLNRAIQ